MACVVAVVRLILPLTPIGAFTAGAHPVTDMNQTKPPAPQSRGLLSFHDSILNSVQ